MKITDKIETKDKLIYYFYTFLFFSFIGWLYEVFLAIFIYRVGYVKRGFQFGPYLPIYGLGTLLLLFFLGKFLTKKIKFGNTNVSPIIIFFLTIVITTALEYISGFLMLKLTNERLWDYTGRFMNFQGIICFDASIRFGFGGLLFLYVLVPFLDKILSKIETKTKNNLAYILMILFLLDSIISIAKRFV